MMKTRTKLTTLVLSVLMALTLCIGLVPMFAMTASAADDLTVTGTDTAAQYAEGYVASVTTADDTIYYTDIASAITAAQGERRLHAETAGYYRHQC